MRLAIGLFALSAAAIVAAWSWLGQPVEMPQAPLARGEKLYCVSYAPFRGQQSPLDTSTLIEAWQIDEDMARLAGLTDCVRTYSTDYGIERVPEIAQRHGLKVIQGLWLSSDPNKNRTQIESAIALANKYPTVIRAVIVGNEVLLRGEMAAGDLGNIMREVKSRVRVPVTYADVWEFWLRNPQLQESADFITIHILPYWEDFPIPARNAGAHVESIRRRVAAAFPNKEIIIGEVGWPSEGRMREGALPSPANQARVVQDVLSYAKRANTRVNLIEAFDQPWKRWLEGTVGGHWGFLDARTRKFKFGRGEAVSNHPLWRWKAAGGVAFAALVFGAACMARGREALARAWIGVAVIASAGGTLIGWTIENTAVEGLGVGGWMRSAILAGLALCAPPVVAAELTAGLQVPHFSIILNRNRPDNRLVLALGVIFIVLAAMAIQIELGLAFDPRYRDFPFAPLTAAALPFLVHSLLTPRASGHRGAAEVASAGLLAIAAVYIVFNESIANWQSLWLCAALAALAFTLARVRGAQG